MNELREPEYIELEELQERADELRKDDSDWLKDSMPIESSLDESCEVCQ